MTVAAVAAAVVALAASCASMGSPYPGGQWKPGPEEFGSLVVHDVPITMSDGVVLMADVGYPTDLKTGERAPGTFPVLLSQNPYTPFVQPTDYFVRRGYIHVIEDVRNTTSRSPAPVEPDAQFFGPRNAQDGVETVDYIAHHLDGSNGTVGLIGCSFLGINQLFTAAKLGPHSPVKAMLPMCAGMGYEVFFDGGVPSFTLGAFGLNPPDLNIAINGKFSKALLDEIMAGGDAAYNRRFWQLRSGVGTAKAIVDNDIPTLLWSGWEALEVNGAIDLYSALQNASVGRDVDAAMLSDQPVSGKYQIIVGQGFHGTGLDAALELEWLDHWLKGQDNGIDKTSTPMHLFEINSKRWINTARVPIDKTVPFYLGDDDQVSTTPPLADTRTLRWAPPEENGTTLDFNTAPLAQTMSVAGPVAATIYASSDTSNLELIATLDDVAPEGTVTKISDGAIIGSLRTTDDAKSWKDVDGRVIKPFHPFTADVPLTPGLTERLDLKMDTTMYSVTEGHSLRVRISTQPSTAACSPLNLASVVGPAIPCLPTTPQKAALTNSSYRIHLGGALASVVNVPLVNPAALAETLACVTPTSFWVGEPMNWDGGIHGPRNKVVDSAACMGA